MSSKASMESRIVTWFQTAPPSKVEVVLGIVRGIVKQRLAPSQPAQAPKRKRRTKQEMATVRAGIAAGEQVARAAAKVDRRTEFNPAELKQVAQ